MDWCLDCHQTPIERVGKHQPPRAKIALWN